MTADVPALLPDARPYWIGPFVQQFWNGAPDRWRLVVCIQGVLVSHGGLSTDYQNDVDHGKDERRRRLSDPYVLADWLNARFERAAREQLGTHRRDRLARIMDGRAPHRFRPYNPGMGPGFVLRGATQVAGHSAEELYGAKSDDEVRRGKWRASRFAEAGLHLVDPCYQARGGTRRFRYAVVQDGEVLVIDEAKLCPKG